MVLLRTIYNFILQVPSTEGQNFIFRNKYAKKKSYKIKSQYGQSRRKRSKSKYDRSKLHETKGVYHFEVEDWLNLVEELEENENYEPVRKEFKLCENTWMVEFYPIGIHEKFDYVSIRLFNTSDIEILASYSVKIINQNNSTDFVWSDPEEFLIFGPAGSGNDCWGNDELMLRRKIDDDIYGWCTDEIVMIESMISVYGDELQSMTQSVLLKKDAKVSLARDNFATSLPAMSEQDIEETKFPTIKRLMEKERVLQDHLIFTRLYDHQHTSTSILPISCNSSVSSMNSQESQPRKLSSPLPTVYAGSLQSASIATSSSSQQSRATHHSKLVYKNLPKIIDRRPKYKRKDYGF